MRQIWSKTTFALLVLTVPMLAQQRADVAGTDVRVDDLQHGSLTVWVVTRATHTEQQRIALQRSAPSMVAPSTFVEKTASELGQSSSSFGQTAGSYGQTSGSFGTDASNTGQTAGSAGKGPNELGQTAGSYGQTAGSYGLTAAEFGRSTSDVNKAVAQPSMTAAAVAMQHELLREGLGSFEDLQVSYVQVVDEEVRDRLAAAEKTASYPDLILGTDLLPWWSESELGLLPLGLSPYLAESGTDSRLRQARLAVILRRAPHPRQARAFVVFYLEEVNCMDCVPRPPTAGLGAPMEAPIAVACSAVSTVLQGGNLGAAADHDAAEFSGALAQATAFGVTPGLQAGSVSGELHQQMDVTAAYGNAHLAVVSLRTIISSTEAFGVLHSLVVLRRDDHGAWKVLQVTPNERPSRQVAGSDHLRAAAGRAAAPSRVLGVSLAAPVDGDVRPPQPELWWDNKGGAAVQVVEWQGPSGAPYSGSELLTLPDTDPRLQTRVPARFADEQGMYRWRVWSVGKDGTVVLSPWRTLSIVGR